MHDHPDIRKFTLSEYTSLVDGYTLLLQANLGQGQVTGEHQHLPVSIWVSLKSLVPYFFVKIRVSQALPLARIGVAQKRQRFWNFGPFLNELGDSAELCIASNLTNFNSTVRTLKISEWRENAYDLGKIPAVFLIGVSQ